MTTESRTKSESQQIAERLFKKITDNSDVFSGPVNELAKSDRKADGTKGKSYWGITFMCASTLDGWIRVFSPGFILFQTTGYVRINKTCHSEEEAALTLDAIINRTF